MTKKVKQKVKTSSAKPKKSKVVARSSVKTSAKQAAPPPKPDFRQDPRFQQAVQNYEAGLKAMQTQKYGRAKAAFEKVIEGPSRELADRARVHLNLCAQQLARTSTNFKTPEEHYDYAVALINNGDYDGARSHLEKIIRQHPKADYAHYGLAALCCLTRQTEEALRSLQKAIDLNGSNRYQARNDTDFANMNDDPRFTELIYPEPGEQGRR
jgi:tetratricopeptide (TPR) repeat protein